MGRTSTVWYWEARKAYYTTLNGKKIKLASTKKAAQRKLKELKRSPSAPASGILIDHLLGAFIQWCRTNRADTTTNRYADFCESFNENHKNKLAESITPSQVTSWLADQQGWNSTTQRNAITVLKRAFSWGKKNFGLKANPIADMEKPKIRPKRRMMPPADFDTILEYVRVGDPFYDYLILSYDTGARPREITRLEARHLDLEHSRAIYPVQEAKGEKLRTVYFPTERSIEILKRLAKERPTGPLLLNTRGNQWNNQAVKSRFVRLAKKAGKRWNAYSLRHGFGTRKLKAGTDSHVVAKLMGHVDVNMIHTTYSHITDDPEYMLTAAQTGEPQKK